VPKSIDYRGGSIGSAKRPLLDFLSWQKPISITTKETQHALLTGAGGGIGLAVTEAYLAEGALCTVADLAPQAPGAVVELLARYPRQLQYVQADVTRPESVGHLLAVAQQRFGPVDILFNNAAVFDMAPLLESDLAMYQRLFDVNVNLASQAGRRGEALVSHYCASKAAVISYTQSAALAMAPYGIRVNGIAPGVVDTPMWGHVDALFARYEGLQPGEKKKAVGLAVPLGRMGTPADLAGAAIFLASDESAYITAQTLNVDGGSVMS
jgi:D-sorbitol dehydrogenase (acceptor)